MVEGAGRRRKLAATWVWLPIEFPNKTTSVEGLHLYGFIAQALSR
jgi:hypothetical protein